MGNCQRKAKVIRSDVGNAQDVKDSFSDVGSATDDASEAKSEVVHSPESEVTFQFDHAIDATIHESSDASVEVFHSQPTPVKPAKIYTKESKPMLQYNNVADTTIHKGSEPELETIHSLPTPEELTEPDLQKSQLSEKDSQNISLVIEESVSNIEAVLTPSFPLTPIVSENRVEVKPQANQTVLKPSVLLNPSVLDCEVKVKSQVNPPQSTPEQFGLLGISVNYLQTKFMAEVRNAGFDETSTMCDIEEHGFIRRKGAAVKCPIEQTLGAAYVHSITDIDDVGKADIMLIYASAYTIGDIVDTLVGYCRESKIELEKTFVWVCCLCNNQHKVIEDKKGSEAALFDGSRKVFDGRVKKIGHVLAVMAPWHAPIYFTRASCVFDLFMASENNCNITFGMTPKARNELMDVMRSDDGVGQINELFQALDSFDVIETEASEKSYYENIMNTIDNETGYDNFNRRINELVRKWILDLLETEVVKSKIKMKDDNSKAQQGSLLNNVGALFRHIGEYDRCLTIGEEALRTNVSVHGRDNSHTARSLEIIGGALYFRGDKFEAMRMHEEALAIRENVLGRYHEDTASSIEWIAFILNDDGEKEEAMKMHANAQAIREKVLGREHEKTASSLNFMATMLQEKGEKQEALKLYKEALEIEEIVLGREHRDTVATISSIASTLYENGELEESLKMFREASQIEEKVYGGNHPQTVNTHEWIAEISYAIENQKS